MTQERIVLRAVHGKTQGILRLNPAKNAQTGRLLGVQVLSPEEQRLSRRPVDEDTQRVISEGLVIDLNDEIDAIDWAWIKENVEIAQDLEAAHKEPRALYYVDRPEKVVEKRLARTSDKLKALNIVDQATEQERRDMCKYLGQSVSHYKNSDILDFLNDRAEFKPEIILDLKKDLSFKTKLFLLDLVDRKVVVKDSNGAYKFGDQILGLNQGSAINWLNDPKNRELTGKFYNDLYTKKEEVHSSIVDEFEKANGLKNIAGLGEVGKTPVGGPLLDADASDSAS